MTAPVAKAEQELTHITERVEAMRAVLVRLLQDVVRAESFLEQNQSVQLLEANEQLVLASLGAQVASESALQALEEVARASGLDPLTQLANRSLAFDRLKRAIAHAKRQGTQLALLFVDLDKFKQINDSKGHAVGDQVLQQVAHCLLSAVRESDTVSRHGGDEFLILLDDLPQVNDALGVAEKLKDMLQLARTANDNWGELSASIGISIYPRDAGTADALIACADLAMYMAKRQGPGGISFFVDDADPLELSPAAPQGSAQGPAEPAMRALQRHSAELARELVKQEQRHLLLREANEQLVLASLSAQDLQAAAAAAQERNSEFMVGVAAELNDPMSPIRIAMAALGRPPDATPLLPHASNLMALQASLIRGFVSDLLQQEQATSSTDTDADKARLLLMLEPLDLAALLDHCAQECQPLLARREQQLQFEPAIKTAPTLWVQGDALRLTQVLSNLLSNASRYSHRGGLIQLSLQGLDARAVITVTDAGIGISPQALQRIFEPFGREFHAVGVYGEALGLGLTAVREIVEAHGGTVRASSAGVGLGSQFMVTLPLSA
ncbi:diguanylate cyclase [Paucibacter sp. TC2R-5]|uniref:diguanylate cyclase domain-containing protein n=1 Tax=Paucibacter sp. TC2R-5 TaxID=2893555 RepID=UPI0021E49BF7|nr:diguanylate cyclase [Paucibacter sp. TC2R-5]MCV2360580.1 diguanylate cyclase [Paucibacter sp. TC2R-5]